MYKKFILLLGVLLLGAAPLLGAQELEIGTEERPSPWIVRMARKGFHLLTSPSTKLDTAYVYQIPLRWTAGVDGTLIGLASDLHACVRETALPGGTVTKESL